ncbi:MAG: hypothetical protein M3450_13345, partial [Actinomycetota bacterium]|nr:hypothetical protein [Actinomycetota bacterium]
AGTGHEREAAAISTVTEIIPTRVPNDLGDARPAQGLAPDGFKLANIAEFQGIRLIVFEVGLANPVNQRPDPKAVPALAERAR